MEWRAELAESLAGRTAQVERYNKICDDVKNAEALQRGAEHHMRGITPERIAARTQNMAL